LGLSPAAVHRFVLMAFDCREGGMSAVKAFSPVALLCFA
jgi:hypothetical protein